MTALSSHPDRGRVTIEVHDVPADLHLALQRIARKNARTLNVQLIHMMVRSLAIEDRLDKASMFIAELRRRPVDPLSDRP
jgi:hypothetical protein